MEIQLTDRDSQKEDVAEKSWNTYIKTKQFNSLNGLRCLCIVPVLWHHSIDFSGMPAILSRGFLGVDMFFVLSGFLIVTLLLREKNQHQTISLRNFYIRRALRIFPIYYGVLIALGIAYKLFKPDDENTQILFDTLPYYLTYTSNWSVIQAANLGIYWSLATEEQFYIVWPFVEKMMTGWALYSVLGIFIIINQMINFGVIGDHWPHLDILDTTFTPICLGVVIAHILHHKRSFSYVYRLFSHNLQSPLYFIILVFLLFYAPADLSGGPRLLIQVVMALWLASMVVNQKHVLVSFLDFPLISRIGEISYGIYLYHMLVFAVARVVNQRLGIELNGYALFITGGLLVFVIAELSFRCYELPFLSLKKKFL